MKQLFMILITLFSGSLVHAETAGETALNEAQAGEKSVFVNFHADWCPTCRVQQKILSKLRQDTKYKDLSFIQVNYDEEKGLRRRFGVNGQSSFLFFKGKTEKARAMGLTKESEIRDFIERALR